jgi:magnesium-transporting ATPase (P-type)
MPVRKFTCPECEAVLRPAKPLPAGRKVTCPKCKASFVVQGGEEEETKPGKPAKKAAPAKPNPFGEEDDGLETYAVLKESDPEQEIEEEESDEDEEDEERPRKKKKKDTARSEDLEFRLDMSIKDPRGPAQAALISPSNFLMLSAFIAVILGVLSIAYGAWPFLFSNDIVDPARVLNAPKKTDEDESKATAKPAAAKKQASIPIDPEGNVMVDQLNSEQKAKLDDARDERWWELFIYMVAGAVVIAYNVVIIVGGVRMQNMESYTWSMVASIMSFIPPSLPALGQLAGVMALTTLRSKKVIEGFFYVPPSATPYAKKKKEDVL